MFQATIIADSWVICEPIENFRSIMRPAGYIARQSAREHLQKSFRVGFNNPSFPFGVDRVGVEISTRTEPTHYECRYFGEGLPVLNRKVLNARYIS